MSALDEAKEMLTAYKEAEKAVLLSKEYWIKGRKMLREDLPEIRKGRAEWERKVAALQSASKSGFRVGRIVPK